MLKKSLFAVLCLVIWFVLLYPFGTLPRFADVFLWGSSPLSLGTSFDNDKTFVRSPYGAIDIGIDSLGVPHIFANDLFSASFGIGYMHARDRWFQVEMVRRTVTGRLSELVGEKALNNDKFWRKFRFQEKAERWFEKMKTESPDDAKIYQAYADGLNWYLKTHPFNETPLEFRLLGIETKPFKASDTYLLIKYMDFMLNYGENRLKHSETKSILGDSLYAFYTPTRNAYTFPIYPKLQYKDSLIQAWIANTAEPQLSQVGTHFPNAIIQDEAGSSLGSNNWAIGPQKSKNGHPILCNDTHLSITLPPVWYEFHISLKGKRAHGLGIPGAPFVISGYNDSLAWGITNATWDLVHFYSLNLKNSEQYVVDGKNYAFESYTDTIRVKGQNPYLFTYKNSVFGVMDSLNDQYLAVNWLGMQDSNEGKAFMGLLMSNNVDDGFDQLKKHFRQPPQNFVLADVEGNIGMMTSGLAPLTAKPVRGIRKGLSLRDLPVWMPLQSYLNQKNPEKGFVVSANQHQVNSPLADVLSLRYEASARARRITHLLDAKNVLSVKDMMQIQLDIVDSEWELLKPVLQKALPPAAFAPIAHWDGRCDTNSIAATLFYSFKLCAPGVFSRMIHPDMTYPPQDEFLFYLWNHHDKLPGTNKNSLKTDSVVKVCWDSSLARLRNQLGENQNDWRFGRFHRFSVLHLTKLAPLSLPDVASAGDNRTVNVASKMPAIHGASMRTIIELKPGGIRAWMLVSGGQSGRINSRHYIDQVDDYHMGKYHAVHFPKEYNPSLYSCHITFRP